MILSKSRSYTINPRLIYDAESVLGESPAVGTRHFAMYMAGHRLWYQEYDQEEAIALVQAWINDSDCDREIESQVRNAYGKCADEDGYSRSSYKEKLPEPDVDLIVELYRKSGGYMDLLDYLRTDGEVTSTRTETWLERLYRPDDLLCIGEDAYATEVKTCSQWAEDILRHRPGTPFGLWRQAFLTPATFRAVKTANGQGRCHENVLERRYFALELDIASYNKGKTTKWKKVLDHLGCTGFDLQAGVVRHLVDMEMPIVSVVHSGNKSLHLWCSGAGFSLEDLDAFILATAPFGVDVKASRIKSQFMRLPNPTHPERQQLLLYFNHKHVNL